MKTRPLYLTRTVISSMLLILASQFLAGCGTAPVREEKTSYAFYPAPPDTPRYQFLVSFSNAKELGEKKRSGLAEHVLGTTEPETFHTIRKPFGIAIHDGKIYVCDTKQQAVDVLDLENRTLTLLGTGATGQLRAPADIYIDEDGKKYVADVGWNRVLIYDENGEYYGVVGNPEKLKPVNVLVIKDRILISDYMDSEIEVWDKNSLEFKESLGESIDQKVLVHRPVGLAKDADDNIYVIESGQFKVEIYDAEGHFLHSFGQAGDAAGYFARPKGIDVDKEGRIYVVDAAFANVQVFDNDGKVLTFIAEPGGEPGQLVLPAEIDIDYDNVELFRSYVHPNYELEFLILVTSQFGPRKVSVYGFIKKKT